MNHHNIRNLINYLKKKYNVYVSIFLIHSENVLRVIIINSMNELPMHEDIKRYKVSPNNQDVIALFENIYGY